MKAKIEREKNHFWTKKWTAEGEECNSLFKTAKRRQSFHDNSSISYLFLSLSCSLWYQRQFFPLEVFQKFGTSYFEIIYIEVQL